MATRTARANGVAKQSAGRQSATRQSASQPARKVGGKGAGNRAGKVRGNLWVVKESAGQSEQGEKHDDRLKLAEYNDTYLECREMRHAWRLLGWFTNGALIIQHAQCQRCPTQRIKRYRRNGIIESTRYEYPEDYQLGGGVQGVSVRAEMIRRAVVWGSEDEMLGHVLSNGNGNGRGRRSGA